MFLTPYRLLVCAALSCFGAAAGCRSDSERAAPQPSKPRPPAKPVDRLAAGELAPGSDLLFGMAVPKGMRVTRKFPDAAYLEGQVESTALVQYLRERVDTAGVELTPSRATFHRAIIKGQPGRVYKIEIVQKGLTSELVMRDVTRPPATEGISEAERWRRAGLTPDGKLIGQDELM
jgi:hypothetical protein